MNQTVSLTDRALKLEPIAVEVRKNIISMIYQARSGHPGGALSATEVVTALYFDLMKIDPENPMWSERDRFILSKGHACPVWYAALAMKGYFPMEELKRLRKFGSILQGHPDMNKTPGVDMTTGSLGQGLSAGLGMALEGKMTGRSFSVFVMVGDGELNEGQIWEAAAAASKFGLDNLITIVDTNGLQMDGFTHEVMDMEPIEKKFDAFGWNTERINGHDMEEVLSALEIAKNRKDGKPVCIVSETVKGKGVSFMENERVWHGKAPNEEQFKKAMSELGGE